MNGLLKYDILSRIKENTKLPCHVIDQKVLFLHGLDTVCIHPTTTEETIKVTVIISLHVASIINMNCFSN